MNTRHSALSAACRSRQAARAAATSGRSCSAACRVFFSRQPGGDEEATEPGAAHRDAVCGQPLPQLGDRQIRLRRQERAHPLAVRRERRALGAADPIRLHRAAAPPTLHRLDHEANADLELCSGRPPRPAVLHRAHHALAQIYRIRSCHPWLAPRPSSQLNHNNRTL
jgi:hypothetical protein